MNDLPKQPRMAPEARRAHILDAAQHLFFERGWESVTIADVLDRAGISKGGFYHHFAAKEDLLDGVVSRFTNQALAAAQVARAATSGNSLIRFNAFLTGSTRWKAEHASELKFFIRAMMRPGNDVLFQRISNASASVAMPLLQELILEGVADQTFHVSDVGLVTESIIAFASGRRAVIETAIVMADNGDLAAATASLDARMVAEGALIDRMLGLPDGSITLSNPDEYQLMLRAMVRT